MGAVHSFTHGQKVVIVADGVRVRGEITSAGAFSDGTNSTLQLTLKDVAPQVNDRQQDEYHTALRQTLDWCRDETGKSHQGYFGPGGWAYERLSELLKSLE